MAKSKGKKTGYSFPKIRELLGLLILFGAGYLLLSLINHNSTDSKLLFYPPVNQPINPSGAYGVAVATYLFHWFGYLSYGVAAGSFLLGLLVFFRIELKELIRKSSAFFLLFIASLTFASYVTPTEFSASKLASMPGYGGIYGEFFSRVLTPRVGEVGTLLLTTLTFATGIIAGTDLLFSNLLASAGRGFTSLSSYGMGAGRFIGTKLAGLGSALWSGSSSVSSSLYDVGKKGVSWLGSALYSAGASLLHATKQFVQFLMTSIESAETTDSSPERPESPQKRRPSPEETKTSSPSTNQSESSSPQPETESTSSSQTTQTPSSTTSGPESETTKESSSEETTSETDYDTEKISPLSSHSDEEITSHLPPVNLLDDPQEEGQGHREQQILENQRLIEETLNNFDINARVTNSERGASVTTYELELAPGEKVNSIMKRSEDLQVSLGQHIRIVSPLPGKSSRIGIEVPNKDQKLIRLKQLWKEGKNQAESMKIPLFLGRNSSGDAQIIDLAEMPHLLIAGTTGAGKSVCLKNLITNQLLLHPPSKMKLCLIDPKLVEFSIFKDIPHLICPIITDMKKVLKLLDWLVKEMEERYELFKNTGCRSLEEYRELSEEEAREKLRQHNKDPDEAYRENIPRIMLVVDELADLMFTSSSEVEGAITRIAQKARAVGIHMLLATQRPTADVLTGLIKSNMPARVSFKVMSKMDSRIILDQNGAENLIGDGDMLIQLPDREQPIRTQGTFISKEEVQNICEHWKQEIHDVRDTQSSSAQEEIEEQTAPEDAETEQTEPQEEQTSADAPPGTGQQIDLDKLVEQDDRDDKFEEAVDIVVRTDRGSVSLLQRKLKIGYTRAARIIDQMEEAGIVGPHRGSKARKVLITEEEWQERKNEGLS